MQQRLLFDLDETIYMGDVVKVARYQLIKEGHKIINLTGADAADYAFSNFPTILRNRISELFKDPMYGCLNKHPLPGIYTFLYYICFVKKWKIGFVTARPISLKESTNYVISRDFPDINWYARYYVNNNQGHSSLVTKEEAIKDFQPTHFFDDHYGYCYEASKLQVPNVFMITNSHTGWNHKHLKNGDIEKNRIIPIKSILELDVRKII